MLPWRGAMPCERSFRVLRHNLRPMIRTLHVDTGREMRGGQWQALYLIERLPAAILLAPENSKLFQEAKSKQLDVRPFSFLLLAKLARQVALVHVHDAHAHTLAAM